MGNSSSKNENCGSADSCNLLEAEREQWIESLRAHLSEQRHDFFNLLQILYGYTQLKKYDRVLMYINEYCRQMENIGRLYNAKCIKLADLLYNKIKEADSIDLRLEVSVEISFEPEVRQLDTASVLYITDHALSAFFYMLDTGGCKGAAVVCDLKENQDDFRIEIYCEYIREGELLRKGLAFPEQELYWTKLEHDISSIHAIISYCTDNGMSGELQDGEAAFIWSIPKKKS